MKLLNIKHCTPKGWVPAENPQFTAADCSEAVHKFIENSHSFVLSYIAQDGTPLAKSMSIKHRDGLKLWFVTHDNSSHAAVLKNNPCVSAFLPDNERYESLLLVGNIALETDDEVRAKTWRDFYEGSFLGGIHDPLYLVFRFEPTHGNLTGGNGNINFNLED